MILFSLLDGVSTPGYSDLAIHTATAITVVEGVSNRRHSTLQIPIEGEVMYSLSFIVESHVHQASSILPHPWQAPESPTKLPRSTPVCCLPTYFLLPSSSPFPSHCTLKNVLGDAIFLCDIVECCYHISRSWEHLGCCITLP